MTKNMPTPPFRRSGLRVGGGGGKRPLLRVPAPPPLVKKHFRRAPALIYSILWKNSLQHNKKHPLTIQVISVALSICSAPCAPSSCAAQVPSNDCRSPERRSHSSAASNVAVLFTADMVGNDGSGAKYSGKTRRNDEKAMKIDAKPSHRGRCPAPPKCAQKINAMRPPISPTEPNAPTSFDGKWKRFSIVEIEEIHRV